jgi:hypothetical protein
VAYELVAEEKFNAAKQAADANAMLAVARSYPNARVSIRALATAAQSYEDRGDHRLAGHVLRQAMRKSVGTAERNAIVEAMARNYLALPDGLDLAIGRLAKAVSPNDDPKLARPMKLADGTQLSGNTFMAVLRELRRLPSATTDELALPDFRLSGKVLEIDPLTQRKRFRKAFLPQKPSDEIAGIDALVVPRAGLERNDRVIGWTGDALAVFAADGGEAIATFKDIDNPPRGAGWIGDDLIVWTDAQVWKLSPDRRESAWEVSLQTMPVLPPVPGADGIREETTDISRDVKVDNGVIIRQRPGQIIINGQVAGLPPGGIADLPARPPMPGDEATVDPDAPEQFIDVRPTATRVVLLTSRGRLAALDTEAGKLTWQVRMAEQGADRLAVTDEFTVARATTERASSLLIVDTFSGDVLARPRYSAELGVTLANFTVSADGTLVYTLADGLATKDLFESWDGIPPNERRAEGGPGSAGFVGAGLPDQLVVNQGLVAALSNGGMVRIYSLLTQREHQQQLSVGGTNMDASLHLIGSQLYTVAPRAFGSFDLINPGPPETQLRTFPSERDRPPTFRDALFGKGHVILLDTMGQPTGPGAAPVATYRLWAFNRDRVNGVENGLLDHIEQVTDKAGITAWQAVDGGLVYHTADGKLHWLRGGRQ